MPATGLSPKAEFIAQYMAEHEARLKKKASMPSYSTSTSGDSEEELSYSKIKSVIDAAKLWKSSYATSTTSTTLGTPIITTSGTSTISSGYYGGGIVKASPGSIMYEVEKTAKPERTMNIDELLMNLRGLQYKILEMKGMA